MRTIDILYIARYWPLIAFIASYFVFPHSSIVTVQSTGDIYMNKLDIYFWNEILQDYTIDEVSEHSW
jgi:hypothetical protein